MQNLTRNLKAMPIQVPGRELHMIIKS